MPLGRFRTDPRDLSETDRAVYARQYPEGLHVLGSGLGLAVPILLGQYGPLGDTALGSPLAAVVGLIVGGVGGYLLGHWLLRRELAAARDRTSDVDRAGERPSDSMTERDSPIDPR